MVGLVRFSRPVAHDDAEYLIWEFNGRPGSFLRVDSVPPGLGREFARGLRAQAGLVFIYDVRHADDVVLN